MQVYDLPAAGGDETAGDGDERGDDGEGSAGGEVPDGGPAEAWARLRSETRLELEALDAKNFWPELERVTRMNLELCRQEPWLLDAALLLNRASPDPANEAVLDEYLERRQEWEAVFIARGQELGAVRSDVPTDLLASMSLSVRQSSNLWILERAKELSADECDTMALQVFGIYRGILSPPTRV